MSELINNARKRKDLLKHMILQLHEGQAPEAVKSQLIRLMGQVPYNDIVEVEQELIAEGLPMEEVLKLCDIHTAALKGAITHEGARTAAPGHPVHTFIEENNALQLEVTSIRQLIEKVKLMNEQDSAGEILNDLLTHFNALMDADKHYLRKENLLFPFLEKYGITGPPTVMWGKHDETREYLKGALEALKAAPEMTAEELTAVSDLVLKQALEAIEGMIDKEEEILFPMSLDKLTEAEWYEIYTQSIEIGFCLYDPTDKWKPAGIETVETVTDEAGRVQLPSGSFTVPELLAILNNISFDLTFVDKDDTVRYFTQGRERIFARNRAILGRKIQRCHPPASVQIVEQILDDFKSGREESSAFWLNLGGRFIHIEYFALKNEQGEYLGTLEVSQDLTEKRKLTGEQRLLNYSKKES